jgi:hypothetical protein
MVNCFALEKGFTFAPIKPKNTNQMKKIALLVIGASMFVATTQAQELMSKRGTPILPEAGDWSIGIDAVPFIDWAFDKTRVFSNTGVTSAGGAVREQQNMTLVGLYMKDANTAYRGKVGINFKSHSDDHIIFAQNAGPGSTVTDVVKTSSMGITLGAGIQKSRGKGRLHGIYGAEVMIGFNGANKTTYEYGNPFILDTTSAHNGQALISQSPYGPSDTAYVSSRPLEQKSGSSFTFGVDGFIGVEYFFAPKMSFSAEYNWGIFLTSGGEGENTGEETYVVNPASSIVTAVRSTSSKTGGNSDFTVGNNNINTSSTGNIVFHFYF